MNIRGVVVQAQGQVEVQELELSEPVGDEILTETVMSGISTGSETWGIQNKWGGGRYPYITGYQNVAIVKAVGSQVTQVRPGDRVVVFRISRPASGMNHWLGCHASHCLARPEGLVVCPEGVGDRDAALCIMSAVALYGVNMAGVEAKDVVAIVGQGLIGQMTAQVCRARGAFVIVSDPSEVRRALSQKYCADRAVNPTEENLEQAVRKVAAEGADVVFESTGFGPLIDEGMKVLAARGTYVFQGYHPDQAQFYFPRAHGLQLKALFPCGWGGQPFVQAALRLIARGHISASRLVTHVYPWAQAALPYRMVLEGRRDELGGLVVEWR